MVRVGHSYLATRWCPDHPPGGAPQRAKRAISQLSGQIWLKLWWIVGVGHGYLSTWWRPNQPPDGASGGQRVLECGGPAARGGAWREFRQAQLSHSGSRPVQNKFRHAQSPQVARRERYSTGPVTLCFPWSHESLKYKQNINL